MLRDLRWLTVTQQLYLRDAVFTFKCMTACPLDYLRSKLVTRGQASGRVTRNSQQLNIPLFRTATGQRSFQYRVVSLWNSLDKDLKLSKNHEAFKRKLKHISLRGVFNKVLSYLILLDPCSKIRSSLTSPFSAVQ